MATAHGPKRELFAQAHFSFKTTVFIFSAILNNACCAIETKLSKWAYAQTAALEGCLTLAPGSEAAVWDN